MATEPGYGTSGYASSTISHGWQGPTASRFDSATSASTWSERKSAIVTTALLENALAASDALPRSHAVALEHAQIDESPSALGGHGGLALGDDVPARDEHRAGAHRRHHGRRRQVHRERRAEGAAGDHQARPEDQDGGGGQADREPPPGACWGRR